MQAHGFSFAEMTKVTGYSQPELADQLRASELPVLGGRMAVVLPYPGGRHPRIGFLKGAINPQRGTKASVFAPWPDGGYAVIDLPEAIFSNLGLTFLAHTHIPTIWNNTAKVIANVDWQRHDDGLLTSEWTLPNGIRFGAQVRPRPNGADCELWLMNGTPEPLTGLRTQVCVMLKGLRGFEAQTNANKTFAGSVATAESADGERAPLVAFERCGRVWGNDRVPCLHSDTVLPDAAPGERVSVRGRMVLCGAEEAEATRAVLSEAFHALTPAP